MEAQGRTWTWEARPSCWPARSPPWSPLAGWAFPWAREFAPGPDRSQSWPSLFLGLTNWIQPSSGSISRVNKAESRFTSPTGIMGNGRMGWSPPRGVTVREGSRQVSETWAPTGLSTPPRSERRRPVPSLGRTSTPRRASVRTSVRFSRPTHARNLASQLPALADCPSASAPVNHSSPLIPWPLTPRHCGCAGACCGASAAKRV